MASFFKSIDDTLRHEGVGLPGNPDGRVDNVNDPGGTTAFGISFRFLKDHGIDIDGDGDVDADDIRHLTKMEAVELYHTYFWTPMLLDLIQDQTVAGKIFDIGVNAGCGQAIRLVQRSLLLCNQNVTVDGCIGPRTVSAINQCSAACLISALVKTQSAFYTSLVNNNPKLQVFLTGWLKRAQWPTIY
jgi:lysozyme family protein